MNKTGIEHMAAVLRATIFAAALFFVPAVVAQDALPNTPPELKDFKLNPEKKPAEPKPEVKAPVIVPPEVKPVKAVPTAIAAPAKRAPEPARKPATSQAEKTASVKATPPPEQAADAPSPAPALVPAVVPPAQALPDSPPEPGFGLNKLNAWTIPAGVALAALALLALGFALWRRRGQKSAEIYEEPETAPVAEDFATN